MQDRYFASAQPRTQRSGQYVGQGALHRLGSQQRDTHLRVNAYQVTAPTTVDQNFVDLKNT
jgi:hypothetical protein